MKLIKFKTLIRMYLSFALNNKTNSYNVYVHITAMQLNWSFATSYFEVYNNIVKKEM